MKYKNNIQYYLTGKANINVFRIWYLYYTLITGKKPILNPILLFLGHFYIICKGQTDKLDSYFVVSVGMFNMVIGDGWVSLEAPNGAQRHLGPEAVQGSPRYLGPDTIYKSNWYRYILAKKCLSLASETFNLLAKDYYPSDCTRDSRIIRSFTSGY